MSKSPKKNNLKTWVLVSIVLLVTFSVYRSNKNRLVVEPSPSAVPITTCKNYTNSEYSFSFQCPQYTNLQVFESDGSDGNSVRGAERKIFVGLPNSDHIYLELFIYRSDLTPELWWNRVGVNKYSKSSITSTSLGNVNGEKSFSIKLTEHHSEYDVELSLNVLARNGIIYLLENSTSDTEQLKTSKEIISTFSLNKSQ